jgi:hypothetical protein
VTRGSRSATTDQAVDAGERDVEVGEAGAWTEP